jgi:hypothetical protein
VQLAVEFAEEIALAVSHVADGVEILPDLMSFLLITFPLFAKDVGQQLCRALESAGSAVLSFGLRQEIERDHE